MHRHWYGPSVVCGRTNNRRIIFKSNIHRHTNRSPLRSARVPRFHHFQLSSVRLDSADDNLLRLIRPQSIKLSLGPRYVWILVYHIIISSAGYKGSTIELQQRLMKKLNANNQKKSSLTTARGRGTLQHTNSR